MRKATDQRDALFMLTTQGCGLMPDIKSRQQFQITGQYAQLPNVIYKAWDSSMQQAVHSDKLDMQTRPKWHYKVLQGVTTKYCKYYTVLQGKLFKSVTDP